MMIKRVFQSGVILTVILLGSACLGAAGSGSQRLAENIEIHSPREGVYIVTHHFPWPSNSMLVRCSPQQMV